MKLPTAASLLLLAVTSVAALADDAYVDGMVLAEFKSEHMPQYQHTFAAIGRPSTPLFATSVGGNVAYRHGRRVCNPTRHSVIG